MEDWRLKIKTKMLAVSENFGLFEWTRCRVVDSRVKSFGKCRSHRQKSEFRSENDFKCIVGTRLKDWPPRNGFGAWSYSTSKVKICNLQLEIPKSMALMMKTKIMAISVFVQCGDSQRPWYRPRPQWPKLGRQQLLFELTRRRLNSNLLTENLLQTKSSSKEILKAFKKCLGTKNISFFHVENKDFDILLKSTQGAGKRTPKWWQPQHGDGQRFSP
jgi:hypothetical protein